MIEDGSPIKAKNNAGTLTFRDGADTVNLTIGNVTGNTTLAASCTDVTATAAEVNKLAGTPAGLTATELGYVDGVTSSIQTQIDTKLPRANIFRGITPTASVFTTDPTTLSNVTDGDVATVTGTGTKTLSAAGDFGILTFDLGSSKRVLVGGRVGIWNANSVAQFAVIESSDDNITWRTGATNYNSYSTGYNAEKISDILSSILEGRYIRIRFGVLSNSGVASVKIYEIWGYELTSL